MKQEEIPKIISSLETPPDAPIEQLRTSVSNWNVLFGSKIQASGFKLLGFIRTDDERMKVADWISKNSVFPVVDMCRPQTIDLTTLDDRRIPETFRLDYGSQILETCMMGDLVFELEWQRVSTTRSKRKKNTMEIKREHFVSLAIANQNGIKYDSILSNVSGGKGKRMSDERMGTDCFKYRMWWIWQAFSDWENWTRGHITICLTAVCDENGNLLACRAVSDCSMTLGTAKCQIAEPKKSGACCEAKYAWGWATGTIEVEIEIEGNGFKVKTKGTFGSSASGEGQLVDCCKCIQK